MSLAQRLSGFAALFALACPAWADSDASTQVARVLQEPRHQDFVQKYLALPDAERDEAFSVLMTEMAGAAAITELPRVLFEKDDASFPRPLKASITSWLQAPPSDKDYENLRYIGLASKPVDVKLKLEKAACDPKTRTVASMPVDPVGPPSIFRRALCTMKTETPVLYWILVVPAVLEYAFDFNPCARAVNASKTEMPLEQHARCVDQVAVSLAVAHRDGEIHEELLLRSKAARLAQGMDAPEWTIFRRKAWESAERQLTQGEELTKTLAARLHVLELLPDTDPNSFQRRRKLVVFSKSTASEPDPRQDYCAWVETYARVFKDPSFVQEELSCAVSTPSVATAAPVGPESRSPASKGSSAAAAHESLPSSSLAEAVAKVLRETDPARIDLPAEAVKVVLATPATLWPSELQRVEERLDALARGAGDELSEPERERHAEAARAVRDELRRRLKR